MMVVVLFWVLVMNMVVMIILGLLDFVFMFLFKVEGY